jgi:autotransporter-associated beta strand protein
LTGVAVTLGGGDDNANFAVAGIGDGNTFATGGITVAGSGAGSVSFSNSGGVRSRISGSIVLNKSITINANAGPFEFTGAISGTGGITKTGGGILALSNGGSSYGGGTIVSNGVLQILNGGALGPGTITYGDANTGSNNLQLQLNATIANTRSFHFTNTGGNVTINSVSGQNMNGAIQGSILIDRGIAISASGNNTSIITISGVISGVGSVRTSSASSTRVVFTGANLYSGGTTVASGTLRVSGSGTTGSGDVQVNSGATLDLLTSTAIADDAALKLSLAGDTGFAVVNLGPGVIETVAALYLKDVLQPLGTYGATGSGAQYINDDYFKGSGVLSVPEPTSVWLVGMLGCGMLHRRRQRA